MAEVWASLYGFRRLIKIWFWPWTRQGENRLKYSSKQATTHNFLSSKYSWNSKHGTGFSFLQLFVTFECVRLIKWHQYIFSVSLKFGACYITGHWGEFRVKNATICLHILFWYFFVVFHHKICVFIIFISFFDKVSNFRNRILTNQKRELMVSNCQRNCMFEKQKLERTWCSKHKFNIKININISLISWHRSTAVKTSKIPLDLHAYLTVLCYFAFLW